MIFRSCRALASALPIALLPAACEQPEPRDEQVEQADWSPHEKRLLAFIARYKTDDPEQALAAMNEELEYLEQPLDENLREEDLAYLRALARIRLAMITHHLGNESGAQALFNLGTMEFNQWAEDRYKKTFDQAKVIETVIDFDQGFEAPWHEPWKSQLEQPDEA